MVEPIFLVDGEVESGRLAQRYLEEGGHSVRTFSTAAEVEKAQEYLPSLMLIASTLPDGSGLDLCKRIRRNPLQSGIPVILMTAGEDQNCAALEAGADNCLMKPFSGRELMARVQAALRRAVRSFPAAPADVVIDHDAMKLCVRGAEVITTTLEFRLLDYLARHRGHTFTRDRLLDAVWGKMQFVTPRSVDACVRRLREKIEPDIASPTYVKTVRGIGYRFDAVAVWPNPPLGRCDCLVCTPSNSRTTQGRSLRLIGREAAS
jgi:two-component system, OmpR family, alkaline phosphatase synthesis response regulator PhoP